MLLLYDNPELQTQFTSEQIDEMDKEVDELIDNWVEDHCGAQPRDVDHQIELIKMFERQVLKNNGIKMGVQ
jgi:hypothetical protein